MSMFSLVGSWDIKLRRYTFVHLEKAMNFLDDMISKLLEPNVVTYITLINGFCEKGEIKKAMNFPHDMICKGIEPNVGPTAFL
jgi:pentatricopeptide repeat protein